MRRLLVTCYVDTADVLVPLSGADLVGFACA